MTAPGPAEPKPAAPASPSATGLTPAPVGTPPAPTALPAVPTPRAASPAPPKSGAAATGAYMLAIVALVLAVAAGAGSAYAWKTARDLKDQIAAAPTQTLPLGTAPATSGTPSEQASPIATTTPTATAPPVVYVADLNRAAVSVARPTGCAVKYVDVDTANVGTEAGHEFYLALKQCNPPDANDLVIYVDRTSGRSASAPNPTTEACASLVAGTAAGTPLMLDVAAGLTFCLLTNATDAAAQSLPQRLAIVQVVSIGPENVQLAVSTYHRG